MVGCGLNLPIVAMQTNGARARVLNLLSQIAPSDDLERDSLNQASSWVASGTDLYRTGAPDVPDMHLVVYFVPLTPNRQHILLVAHRKAGLWLPPGGHVEPDEDPWDTVTREATEELHLTATPAPTTGPTPIFLTITRTRGQLPHTDVTMWFPLETTPDQITTYGTSEFTEIHWWPLTELRSHLNTTAAADFEPHLSRFLDKIATQPT
jgi:8-oxo-dGTP pyrophosphatase MutT (NUDIX family)